jgi:N6-L-threonylcarbamoyladenine synthase
MNILGIESSCDETAAAVVSDGRVVHSSVVASQVDIHRDYGGVVPELASRHHLEAVVPVVRQALAEAGPAGEAIDGVAVTRGPGLVGALLVGFNFARAWAFAKRLPIAGVDHLHGHLYSVFLEPDPPAYPFVALLASGGHTGIYHVTGPATCEKMGATRDDAAGEAFDKVSKLLGLGYPGGSVIGRLAKEGDPHAIRFPRAFLDKTRFDFSFSGIKSAVGRYVRENASALDRQLPDIAAGFQEAVVDVLAFKLKAAAAATNCTTIAIVGGVAANHRLRECMEAIAGEEGFSLHIPGLAWCGDNAAMIAAVGYHQLLAGETLSMDADAYSRSPIG